MVFKQFKLTSIPAEEHSGVDTEEENESNSRSNPATKTHTDSKGSPFRSRNHSSVVRNDKDSLKLSDFARLVSDKGSPLEAKDKAEKQEKEGEDRGENHEVGEGLEETSSSDSQEENLKQKNSAGLEDNHMIQKMLNNLGI